MGFPMISETSLLDIPILTYLLNVSGTLILLAHAPSWVQTNIASVIFLIMTTSGCALVRACRCLFATTKVGAADLPQHYGGLTSGLQFLLMFVNESGVCPATQTRTRQAPFVIPLSRLTEMIGFPCNRYTVGHAHTRKHLGVEEP